MVLNGSCDWIDVYVIIENDDNLILVVKSVVWFEKKSVVWIVGVVVVCFIKLWGYFDGGGCFLINIEFFS